MLKSKLNEEEKKERKRLMERIRKAKIKSDPVLREQHLRKDRERLAKRKAAGLILTRSQMTAHARRNAQKKNRISARAYYQRKKNKANGARNNPTSVSETNDAESLPKNQDNEPGISQELIGPHSPRLLRQNVRCNSPNLRIDAIVASSSHYLRTSSPLDLSIASPLRTPSISSINSEESTLRPNSPNLDTSFNTVKFKQDIKMKFRKYQNVKTQQIHDLRKQLAKANKEKLMYKKRYMRLHQEFKKLKQSNLEVRRIPTKPKNIDLQKRIRKIVVQFFEDDENSNLCPGKKDTVTQNGVKKQKRLMKDTIKNLHKKYLTSGYPPISYVTFTRMRPFWVTQPKLNLRNTCLCEKHENMDLVISSLKRNRIIKENTTTEILSSICCDIFKVECLQRTCPVCKNRHLNYQEFDNSKDVIYWNWKKIKKNYKKNGVDKIAVNVEKVKITVKPLQLIKIFENNLKPFLTHCSNIRNQSQAFKHYKQNMTEKDCVVHIDFSENYSSKYGSEIQSMHFGGSRQQFTLHTAVIYYKNKEENITTQCFCTISSSLRHDAAAVWAHLVPILEEIKQEAPIVQNLIIISDSPSGQYRNKKIFYIMSQLSIYCSSLTNIIWNYSECGHGKGAPDGVGGLLKRTADRFVAHDGDMNNIDSFVNYLKSAVQGVKISTVEEYEVEEKDWLLPTNLNTFRGTLQVKQVIWTKEAKNRIVLRRLSCIEDECMKYVVKCPHGKHLDFHNLSTEHEIKSKPQLSTSSNKKSRTKSKIDITKMRPVKLTDKLILFPQPSHSKYFTPSNTLKISENAAPRSSSSTKMSENLLLNYVDLDQSTPACSFLEKIDTNILVGLEESTQFVNKEDTVKASNRFSSPTVEDSDTDEEIFRIKSKINFKKEKNEPRKPTPDIKQRFNYIFGCSDTDDDLF